MVPPNVKWNSTDLEIKGRKYLKWAKWLKLVPKIPLNSLWGKVGTIIKIHYNPKSQRISLSIGQDSLRKQPFHVNVIKNLYVCWNMSPTYIKIKILSKPYCKHFYSWKIWRVWNTATLKISAHVKITTGSSLELD